VLVVFSKLSSSTLILLFLDVNLLLKTEKNALIRDAKKGRNNKKKKKKTNTEEKERKKKRKKLKKNQKKKRKVLFLEDYRIAIYGNYRPDKSVLISSR
jgi:hypothetical protein